LYESGNITLDKLLTLSIDGDEIKYTPVIFGYDSNTQILYGISGSVTLTCDHVGCDNYKR